MVGKPQTLSNGQKKEVVQLFQKRIVAWIVLFFVLLTGLTGYSLWDIKERIENKAESLVSKQFEEPKIQEIVQNVAAEQAAVLMSERIEPQVTKFKAEVAEQLKELYSLVAEIKELKAKSQEHEQSIEKILIPLQYSLKQSQDAINQLSTVVKTRDSHLFLFDTRWFLC